MRSEATVVTRLTRGLLAALVMLLTACQVTVDADVRVREDGSGTLGLVVELDDELTEALAMDAGQVFASMEQLPDGWSSEVDETGQSVHLSAPFTSPAQLRERVDQLHAGLEEGEDPALIERLDLSVAEDGSTVLTGSAGFVPPSSTGLRGGPVTFEGEDLASLLAERGDEVLTVDLAVHFPGQVAESNADDAGGSTATWHLPLDGMREISATSNPPNPFTTLMVGGGVLLLGLAIGLGLTRTARRKA